MLVRQSVGLPARCGFANMCRAAVQTLFCSDIRATLCKGQVSIYADMAKREGCIFKLFLRG
jgi:hypothetical protein